MADSDAEWIDVDNVPAPRTRPPPIPRPGGLDPTVTRRPGRPFRPNGPRRPRPQFPRRRGADAPDRLPPGPTGAGASAATISVSVISALILVALLLLLLYLLVLKKKLRKVKKSHSESQFSLRVEDVSHMNIDDSSKLYVNTTDLQKLVSSVRIKNKKPMPPPGVVAVERPPAALPGQGNIFSVCDSSGSVSPSDVYVNNHVADSINLDEPIYANVADKENISPFIARPAPPPPSFKNPQSQRPEKETNYQAQNSLNRILQAREPTVSSAPPKQLRPQSGKLKPSTAPPPPPTSKPSSTVEEKLNNQHSIPSPPSQNSKPSSLNETKPSDKISNPLPPPASSKPNSLNKANTIHKLPTPLLPPTSSKPSLLNETKTIQKLPTPLLPPTSAKPSLLNETKTIQKLSNPLPHISSKPKVVSTASKPLLPRLKMNLMPKNNGPDSGFSTPDTALSYITETPTDSSSQLFEPGTMSVKARKAYLEGVFANK